MGFISSSFPSFSRKRLVSVGVIAKLHLTRLNFFNKSVAYFVQCIIVPNSVALNSIPKKQDRGPRSLISNSLIIFLSYSAISFALLPITKRSSIYRHTINKSVPVTAYSAFKYTPCSDMHLIKPIWLRKLSILLLKALGACLRPYKAFLILYTFSLCL